MNRTEAVVRMLRGEILRDDIMYLRIKDGKLQMNAVSNDPDSGWINWRSGCDYLSEPSLRVVEPKSKIEEAIDREVADYFGVSPMESHRSQVAEAMRRVVNLALDEAKKCNKQTFCEICEKQFAERIDALKVKE